VAGNILVFLGKLVILMKAVIQTIDITGLPQSGERRKEVGAMQSQNAADQLRAEGWTQGCLIHPDNAVRITAASIDFYSKATSGDTWLVVLTQDCDIVRHTGQEPFVELLAIEKLSNIPANPMKGQSARSLHLNWTINDDTHWFECNIHDKFRIRKDSLCGLDIDTSLRVEENELRLLRQWLARRYTRAAFPDHFEEHLASTKGRVKSLFKSPEAKLISTVYIAIENEDAGPDEDYLIHVLLTALAEDFEETERRELLDDFEERFIQVIGSRPHIRFALKNPDDPSSYDVRVLPEEDVTLSMLRKYRRFDADYRSIDDDAVSPPESIEIN
jgi:hypothetical protein